MEFFSKIMLGGKNAGFDQGSPCCLVSAIFDEWLHASAVSSMLFSMQVAIQRDEFHITFDSNHSLPLLLLRIVVDAYLCLCKRDMAAAFTVDLSYPLSSRSHWLACSLSLCAAKAQSHDLSVPSWSLASQRQ
jgi:hypothetical protein